MDFSSVCRTCLSTKSLNPIFMDTTDLREFSRDIYWVTGVQIQINDGLPQNMCTECVNHVNAALKFRTQCQNAETELLTIKSEIKHSDIDIIDNVILIVSHDAKKHVNKQLYTESEDESSNFIKEEAASNATESIDVITDIKGYTNSEYDIKDDDEYLAEIEIKPSNLLNETDTLPCDTGQKTTKKHSETVDLNTGDTVHESKDEPVVYKQKVNTVEHEECIELPYRVLSVGKNEKIARVMCKLCQKELSIRSIDLHMARRHPGADERKTKCELCDAYVLKEKLNRHMVLMHGTEALRCSYCKLEFDSRSILIEHIQSCAVKHKKKLNVTRDSGRELTECDVCHQKMQKASLRMHKRIKHAGLRPVCEHCGNTFGNKLRLHEHYRAKHDYEKFKCSCCEFTSANIVAMRNHERRHRGEMPFVCETCGAKFHAAYLLAQHKHSHRTEKTVKCDLCPATFKANNSLYMHRLTCHSKAKYKCGMCRRAYSCRHYAAKHLRHAHRFDGGAPPLVRVPSDDTDDVDT